MAAWGQTAALAQGGFLPACLVPPVLYSSASSAPPCRKLHWGCRAATEQLPQDALLTPGGWGKPAELRFLSTLLREKPLCTHLASFNGQSNDTRVKNSRWDHSGVSTAGCSESLLTPV